MFDNLRVLPKENRDREIEYSERSRDVLFPAKETEDIDGGDFTDAFAGGRPYGDGEVAGGAAEERKSVGDGGGDSEGL